MVKMINPKRKEYPMSQKPQSPQKPKKLSRVAKTWIVLSILILGIGLVLYQSKPMPLRYTATAKPFVLPTMGTEEAIETPEAEIKEEELIKITQPNPLTPEPASTH
jgi:hypothetical protein